MPAVLDNPLLLEDPNHFKTYVVQFVMQPFPRGYTFMRLWTITPRVGQAQAASTVPVQANWTHMPTSLDLFKLLENDHSNGTKTAERFIQYHLGRIHKELLSLHDAVPDRPPRTFNVYLQWPTTRIQPPANTNHFSGYFQIVSDSINSAYFSSGIRFRLAQSVRPSGPDSGIITSPCDWAPLNTNFRNLVQDYIQSLEEQIVAFVTVHPSAAAGHGDTRELCVYIFRYRKAANDYCRRPHQVVRIQHLAGQATTTTIKDLITGIIGEYTVKHLFINRMDLQLLPDRTSFPGLGGDLDAWSENSHPDQGFHIIDGPEVAQPPSIIQAADVVCRRLSKPEVYQYGVVMDAGSSGTRSYVYKWKRSFDIYCNPVLPGSMEIVQGAPFKASQDQYKRGIAKLWVQEQEQRRQLVQNYMEHFLGGTRHLIQQDDHAIRFNRIPLFVLATGGMRALKESRPTEYGELRADLTSYLNRSGFLEPTYDTITGAMEGIYSWVDVNFAKDKFVPEKRPYGIVEMGGQTLQLAFTRMTGMPGDNPWGGYRGRLTKVNLGPKLEYNVFVRSWGNLGANALWNKHFAGVRNNSDPCIARNYTYTHQLPGANGQFANVIITGTGKLFNAMRDVFLLFECLDASCRGGDICCLGDLKRGCLLKEVKGLEFNGTDQQFIGVSNTFWYALDVLEAGAAIGDKMEVYDFVRAVWEASMSPPPLANANEDQHPILVKKMFSQVLTFITVHIGLGIPMPKYATECVRLAAIWFQVEALCVEANSDPQEELKKRLRPAAEQAFSNYFPGLDHSELFGGIMDAIFDDYYRGNPEPGKVKLQTVINQLQGVIAQGAIDQLQVYNQLRGGLIWMKDHGGIRCTEAYVSRGQNDHIVLREDFRDVCFEFVSRSLNWTLPEGQGASFERNFAPGMTSPLDTWARGKMLLNSVGTEGVVQSFGGWQHDYEA